MTLFCVALLVFFVEFTVLVLDGFADVSVLSSHLSLFLLVLSISHAYHARRARRAKGARHAAGAGHAACTCFPSSPPPAPPLCSALPCRSGLPYSTGVPSPLTRAAAYLVCEHAKHSETDTFFATWATPPALLPFPVLLPFVNRLLGVAYWLLVASACRGERFGTRFMPSSATRTSSYRR